MVKRKLKLLNTEVPIKTVSNEQQTGAKQVKLAGLPCLERRRSLRGRAQREVLLSCKENVFVGKENKKSLQQCDNAKREHDNPSGKRILRSCTQKLNSQRSITVDGLIVKPAKDNAKKINKGNKPLLIPVAAKPSTIADSDQDRSDLQNAFKKPHPKQPKSQPFSSTPMKSCPPNIDTFGKTSCTSPKLLVLLSPINASAKSSTRVAVGNETVTLRPRNFKKDENVNDECHTFSKMRPSSQLTAPMLKCSEPKAGRMPLHYEEKVTLFDSIRKYSRAPKKRYKYLSSDSDSIDSSSGEYDPLKLFNLRDPITTEDMPEPKSSKYRSCELKEERDDDPDFLYESKKPTKARRDAPKCHDAAYEGKVQKWLQEAQEKNAEFNEIENLDLYIE